MRRIKELYGSMLHLLLCTCCECQGRPFGEDRHFYGQSGVEKFMSVKGILSFIS